MMNDPISYEGNTVVIDTKLMDTDRAYWLIFRNLRTAVIKHKDGSVVFYRIPRWLIWLTDQFEKANALLKLHKRDS